MCVCIGINPSCFIKDLVKQSLLNIYIDILLKFITL